LARVTPQLIGSDQRCTCIGIIPSTDRPRCAARWSCASAAADTAATAAAVTLATVDRIVGRNRFVVINEPWISRSTCAVQVVRSLNSTAHVPSAGGVAWGGPAAARRRTWNEILAHAARLTINKKCVFWIDLSVAVGAALQGDWTRIRGRRIEIALMSKCR